MATSRCVCLLSNIVKSNNLRTLIQRRNPIRYAHQPIRTIHNVETRRLCSTSINDKEPKWVDIYRGRLSFQIKGVKIFSLLTSGVTILTQPLIYNEIMRFGSTSLIVVAYTFVGIFTFLTPLLLHFITKKYVVLMQYNPETDRYTAVTYGFFSNKKKVEFCSDDVMVPAVPGMFTSFVVKGKHLFVEPSQFLVHQHYGQLMGFHKPLDLKLYETSLNEKNK